MRYQLTIPSLQKLFEALERDGHTVVRCAELVGVHERTVRDWRRGKFTIPGESFQKLIAKSGLDSSSLEVTELSDLWHVAEAGRVGGRVTILKHKTIGTVESRRKGGQASYIKRKDDADDIFAKTTVHFPSESPDLAEFIGIMIGDGSVGQYQISITLNRVDDAAYAVAVVRLIEELFGVIPRCRNRKQNGCVVIEVSSVDLVKFLVSKGLPVGDKLQHGIRIPPWITNNREYVSRCLRGMFDTDGSIFQEKHCIKGRVYAYPRMMFVSASETLLDDALQALSKLGICAKVRQGRAVSIEHFTDIAEYFRIVGSSNPKHLSKYVAFGGVG